MNLERYDFLIYDGLQHYEFESEGPNGKITKIVQFTLVNSNGVSYFNLAFGDWNSINERIDDMAVTNNSDRKKVLATVASIVLLFTELFPDMFVYAEGSTPARTRLYQMGILAHYQEIQQMLYVYGLKDNKWQPFEKGVNYEAFLIQRR